MYVSRYLPAQHSVIYIENSVPVCALVKGRLTLNSLMVFSVSHYHRAHTEEN